MQNLSVEALALGGSVGVRDAVIPDSQWRFDADVTDAFDDMLKRSIPQYSVMRDITASLATEYAKEESLIVDLGTSRGEALACLIARIGRTCRYLGLEISKPMLEAARKRLTGVSTGGCDVRIDEHDLRNGLPDIQASVILSILTLQFTPIEYRLKIVKDVFDKLDTGGAFFLVEKVLGSTANIDSTMVRRYYDFKSFQGYSDEQIERKRLSLEGVLVPITAQWNEQLLRDAGFKTIDCYWRWMNFAGWIAVK